MGFGSDDSGRADPPAAMVSYPSLENVLLGPNGDGPAAGPERIAAGGAQSTTCAYRRIVYLRSCAGRAPRAASEPVLGCVLRGVGPRPEARRALVAKAHAPACHQGLCSIRL